jgi:GTP-binding protein Era
MRCGTVALVGRPNAGKSTLLNRIVGQKLAIVSDKPQTTRSRITGVKQYDDAQVIFVDTPGIHKPTHRLNARMVDAALEAMRDVDVVVLVVDASVRPGRGDEYLLTMVKRLTVPVVLVLSKVDLVAKAKLLPMLDRYRQAHPFADFVPLSGVDGTNVEAFERVLVSHLPEGEALCPPDYLTSQTERFQVAELVREQVLRLTHDELPFSTTVVVDRFEEPADHGITRIYCTIWVERDSQKGIVVGHGGSMVREIGTAARVELERELDRRIHLDLHVKVKADWRNNERLLDEIAAQNREES